MAENEVQDLNEKVNWHWRNSMRIVRFINFDARAAVTLPILIFYPRLSTIILTFIVMYIFNWLEKKGLTFPAALRQFRMSFVGDERPGQLGVYQKKFRTYY